MQTAAVQDAGIPASERPSSERPPSERPWIFGLLIAPAAVLSNGIIGGVLSYLLRNQGVGPARGAEIIALLNLPQAIYFLWSPLTDFWMRRRTWLMVAAIAGATAVVAAFCAPSLASPRAIVLLFLGACMIQLAVASCGGIMGTLQREESRRKASAFYQGSSLAFGAGGLFVLASLSARLSLVTLGWVSAAMIALPSLAAIAAPNQPVVREHGIAETFARIWEEFKSTFLRWKALPYTLVMLFPMGSGAMIQLLPGLAADYHISGLQVGWINGLAGSLLTAAGALITTLIPAKVRAPVAYLSICIVNAAALAVLWLGPLRPGIYLTGSVLYLFTVGACYATFTAVVLEFLGNSGKSGSARYSIINSLGNVPVIYMVALDGRGYARWGARGMPATDAVLGAIGGAILLAYFLSRSGSRETLAGEIA